MELLAASHEAVDLTDTPLHLGAGGSAAVVAGFGWEPEVLKAYSEATAADGPDGRLVMLYDDGPGSWSTWECHPAGDEVVICLSGRMTMIQEAGGTDRHIELTAGQAMINPAGVWHTADIHEPVRFLAITPGAGTDHRPR
jgi:mannose-6-phosphate isomerase-like protein (cupin superfamily)